ncbi:MAG TPA: hypothetical protein VFC60_01445 [Tissierellaceae bacterium]|nr:hypothetical protein [Tissierellaceae bacterium]
MKHYDYVEWVLYKKNLLNKKTYNEMEEHLFQCDICMDIFLSLIDEEEIENAKFFIPADFNKNLMNKIENITPIKQITKKNKKKQAKFPKDFFLYYTATAAVAILLTAGGIFNTMVDNVPRTINIENSKLDTSKIYNFTEKISQETSNFIYNFSFIKDEEAKEYEKKE